MKDKTVSDFEDSIDSAEEDYRNGVSKLLNLIRENPTSSSDIQNEISAVHTKAVNYFSLFERSIVEFSLNIFETNNDIVTDKAKSAINVANNIARYWQILNLISNKYQVRIPKPANEAYDAIQGLILAYDKSRANELRVKFEDLGLPINGFNSTNTPSIMTKKRQITYGIISGTVLLAVLILIALFIDCPTEFQTNIFRIILALATAAYSAAIPGALNVNYKQIITATGAIAVFVIVYFWNPATISDFNSCQRTISGTIYYGKSPKDAVELLFVKQHQSTTTDNFGNFILPLDYQALDELLRIQIKKEDLGIDTTIELKKEDLDSSIDIYLNEYCLTCYQVDSIGTITNRRNKCNGSKKYIDDYIDGYKQRSKERNFSAECAVKKAIASF